MSPADAEIMDGIPPTFRFRPTKRELVEFYLLPHARGQDPFPGVIIEDDAAASSLPWALFERHGLGSEDEAYFLVRTSDAKKPGARQDRGCEGGVGTWKMQSSLEKGVCVSGEKIQCRMSNLNLHMGKGKDGGSVGWVMHEYTIAEPPCPLPVKICHIAFTGHGRKRKRVPDGQEDCQSERASQRARVDATEVGACSGAVIDHNLDAVVHASAEQDFSPLFLTEDDLFRQISLLGSSDFLGFPSTASANAEKYQELEQQVPSIEEQDSSMLHLTEDNIFRQSPLLGSSDFLGFPSVASANAEQYQELEQQVPSTEEQDSSQLDLTENNIFHQSPLLGSSEFLGFPSAASSNAYRELEQLVPSKEEQDSSPLDLTENIFPESPLLGSSDFLGFPSSASANAEQFQELKQQMPSTEEQQIMMPQLMAQRSSMAEPEQLCAGELEFWSSIGVNVQSSNWVEQESWNLIGFASNSVVPHISNMAGEHQDQQDFWSLTRADVQSNCAALDMAARALGGGHWGGYSITC